MYAESEDVSGDEEAICDHDHFTDLPTVHPCGMGHEFDLPLYSVSPLHPSCSGLSFGDHSIPLALLSHLFALCLDVGSKVKEPGALDRGKVVWVAVVSKSRDSQEEPMQRVAR